MSKAKKGILSVVTMSVFSVVMVTSFWGSSWRSLSYPSSSRNIDIDVDKRVTVSSENRADISQNASIRLNTGFNSIRGVTGKGSDVSIRTGTATADVDQRASNVNANLTLIRF